MTNKNLNIFPLIIICAVAVVDQLTKLWSVSRGLSICNRGFAFGLWSSGNLFLSFVLPFLITAAVIFLLLRSSSLGLRIALALIAGGGISNMIDRMVRGCVVDFVDLKIWPSFNLADSAITVGVAVLLFLLIIPNLSNSSYPSHPSSKQRGKP